MSEPVVESSYMAVNNGPVTRTVDLGGGVLIDVNEDDRIVGVESIGVDFSQALATVVRVVKVAT